MRWIATTMFIGIAAAAVGQEKPAAVGGIEVYAKIDFDEGANPFVNEARGVAVLETRPEFTAGGRSLHIRRGHGTARIGLHDVPAIHELAVTQRHAHRHVVVRGGLSAVPPALAADPL